MENIAQKLKQSSSTVAISYGNIKVDSDVKSVLDLFKNLQADEFFK